MKMCPEAKIDDGLLDITYVQNVPPEKVPELLQTLAMGGRDNDDLAESIKTMRVPWLEVVTSHSVHAWLK
jgi:diacylglycerol kinase family enzyme